MFEAHNDCSEEEEGREEQERGMGEGRERYGRSMCREFMGGREGLGKVWQDEEKKYIIHYYILHSTKLKKSKYCIIVVKCPVMARTVPVSQRI